VAKVLSSAYLPIAATVVSDDVFRSFYGDPAANRHVMQVNTYGGHPAAAAVALRNIEIMLTERLADRAAETGGYLLDALRTLSRHPWVGDVRGKGLLAGVELVRDRKTKEIMPAPQMQALVDYCLAHGVIVGRSAGGRYLGNTITLAPPLVLTRREVDRIVSVLDQGIGEVGRTLSAA
jgi:taurine-pyruvate aminotransferase